MALTVDALDQAVRFPDLFAPGAKGLATYARRLFSTQDEVVAFAGLFDTFTEAFFEKLAEDGVLTGAAADALRADAEEVIRRMLKSKSDLSGRIEELPDDLAAAAGPGISTRAMRNIFILLLLVYVLLSALESMFDVREITALSAQLVMARAFMTALGQREAISYRFETQEAQALGAPDDEATPLYLSEGGDLAFNGVTSEFRPPAEFGGGDDNEAALAARRPEVGAEVDTQFGPTGGEIVIPEDVLEHVWEFAKYQEEQDRLHKKAEEKQPDAIKAVAAVAARKRQATAAVADAARELTRGTFEYFGFDADDVSTVKVVQFLSGIEQSDTRIGKAVRYSNYYVEAISGWRTTDYIGAQILMNARQHAAAQGAGLGKLLTVPLPWEQIDINHQSFLVYQSVAADHPEIRLLFNAHATLELSMTDKRGSQNGRQLEGYIATFVRRFVLDQARIGVQYLILGALAFGAARIATPILRALALPLRGLVFPVRRGYRLQRLRGEAQVPDAAIEEALKEADGDFDTAAARLLGLR